MHADAAVENLLIQELSRGLFDRLDEWVEHDWRLEEGFIEVSDVPGLGTVVREERLDDCRYDRASPDGRSALSPRRRHLERMVERQLGDDVGTVRRVVWVGESYRDFAGQSGRG